MINQNIRYWLSATWLIWYYLYPEVKNSMTSYNESSMISNTIRGRSFNRQADTLLDSICRCYLALISENPASVSWQDDACGGCAWWPTLPSCLSHLQISSMVQRWRNDWTIHRDRVCIQSGVCNFDNVAYHSTDKLIWVLFVVSLTG